ncbi:MAG: SpoIIE family protein phosphatase [Bryobacterales bacterium]|nr:SpoIIE family protein phosphatase [Bryobacterales bacterium]
MLAEDAVERKASETIGELPALRAGFRKEKCELTTRRDSRGDSRRYSCQLRIDAEPALSARLIMVVRGSQVTEQSLAYELTDEAEKSAKTSKLAAILFFSYLGILFLFMVVRYFQRRAQKEISRQRMFAVTAIITAFLASQVMLEDEPVQISNADVAIPYWVPMLLVVIFGYLVGQMAGLAYAAAEGDLRERRASQLTSLDAFLSGQLFSRNVGRSVVLGTVLLGWMLLLRNSAYLALSPTLSGLEGLAGHSYLFSRLPWLSLLVAALSSGVLQCLTALACPLSILERRFRRAYWIWPVLVLGALITAAFQIAEPFSAFTAIVLAAIHAAGLLASFFGVDFFAALVVATGAPLFIEYAGLAHLSPLWYDHGIWVAVIACVWVAVQTACAFFGRVVDPAKVRPAYASEIHERQQLESEVAAAREAQQRLLPAAPPVIAGLHVAASCNAAETVNGDFYDYFPISRTRLGVLIIDGGGTGLATALTIALAKGFLMHKAQEGLSPIETLRSLRATLGKELEGESGEGICFLTLDVAERAVRYARFGDTPSVLIAGNTSPVQEVRYSDPGITMWEGFATLSMENRVIAYTNGLSRLVGEPDRHGTDRWLHKKLGGLHWQPAGEFLESILTVARRGRFGKRKLTDDVTVMVCSLDGSAAQSMEEVA